MYVYHVNVNVYLVYKLECLRSPSRAILTPTVRPARQRRCKVASLRSAPHAAYCFAARASTGRSAVRRFCSMPMLECTQY